MQSQEIKTYILPNEDYCRNIALQPWPKVEKYDPVLEQIEKISGVKPKAYPPNEKSLLNRFSELLLNIPKDLLLIMDGRVYFKYIYSRNCREFCNLTISKWNKWINFIDKYKSIIPPISYGFGKFDLRLFDYEWFNNEDYLDDSEDAKKRLKEIALKPWDS